MLNSYIQNTVRFQSQDVNREFKIERYQDAVSGHEGDSSKLAMLKRFIVTTVKAAIPVVGGAATEAGLSALPAAATLPTAVVTAIPVVMPYIMPVAGAVSLAYAGYKAVSYFNTKPVEIADEVTKFTITDDSEQSDYYLVSDDNHWSLEDSTRKLTKVADSNSYELRVRGFTGSECKFVRYDTADSERANPDWQYGDNLRVNVS
ncbi:hypothetical protein [Endozoicomonas sp.]|uniref:hypothetical protein n=1 Tax=Endozoicomonas sp. TaxID=1892382 RepID=UPI003AF6B1E8